MTEFEGKEILKIEPEALTLLANVAIRDVSFLLRTAHLEKVAAILKDPQASDNDRYVALAMLRNADTAAKGILPFCQDTGTATIFGKKGQQVWTGVKDEEYLAKGVYKTYTEENLRYSQTAPLNMYDEVDTGTNLPAQIDLMATEGMEYQFLFVTKGGGSANKTSLYQETKALLNPASLEKFLTEKMKTLGTAGCPPYHLAFVIGGTSAEACLKTVKLATTGYLDHLPTTGNAHGRAFRDVEIENKMLEQAYKSGYGAQFGGKYFALDVRIIRLPRHGASCPVGMGVSCSADRNAKAKINKDGIWLEELERDPGRLIPEEYRGKVASNVVQVDLNRPMAEILAQLTKYPVTTQLSLTGTMIVARDIAHAKIERTIGSRRGHAAVHERSSGLLCRAGENSRRYAVGFFRADDGGTDGLLRGFVSVARRGDDHARQGQSQPAGHRRLQKIRRLLSRLDRRPGGDPGERKHQESRSARISGARHGSDLEDRGGRFSRVYPSRR